MDVKIQVILLWITVAFYAASSVVVAWQLVRGPWRLADSSASQGVRSDRPGWGVWLALVGLIPHTAAILLRWLESGHGPYMRVYEVYSSDVWIVVLLYLLVQWRRPRLRFMGAVIMPTCFLLIGMAVMASPEIRPLPPFYGTYWLIVHILFAKLSYGFLLIGTALAVFYLIKNRVESRMEKSEEIEGKPRGFLAGLPDLPSLQEQSYQFIAFGFIMLAIMIAAGAIWANKAWGRYWSWDPVETWSLMTWLLYGIYLHLVRTYGWTGRRAAWFTLAAVVVMIFALFGVGLVYQSLHSPYIR